MTANPHSLLYTLAKLLALPWRLATYQPSPTGPAQRGQGSVGSAEEDVELGLYLRR